MNKIIDETYINNIQNYSKEVLNYVDNKNYFDLSEGGYKFLHILNFVSDIDVSIMDVYTLCRIFRQFNTKNNEQPIEPSNIIIYAGDYHASIYRQFFMKNDFKCIKKTGDFRTENKNRCLDMSGIRQPLFSYI